ncbi:hypothetical protein GGE65_007300 [Skermanella aerolata]|uniref:hypothetical protein n=1 Tax=Skermanella aerolata TaxID=393310 RepID=UPI003D2125DF
MAHDPDTLRGCLYRLAELVELARQVPSEDRARMNRMVVQARQAVCEARRSEQRARVPATRTIVLRLLVKVTPSKVEFPHRR